MAGKWQDVKLGDVITLKRGYDLPKRKRNPGSVPVVSSAGFSGHHDEAKANPPGVVVGRYGTLGEVYYVEEPFWPLNTALYVQDFKGNDPRFVSYLLETIHYRAAVDKAAVPGVNRNDLHQFRVKLPPLGEQKAIADQLGTLDDKIDLNRRMNETLESMARAIFKSWFVDFDPVIDNALRAGNPIPEEFADRAAARREALDAGNPVVGDEVGSLFPGGFEKSDLGPVPVGWKPGVIGDQFDLTLGLSPPGSTYNEDGEGVPFYQGRKDFGFRYPGYRVYCTEPKRFAEKGDSLVSIRAPVGDVNMARERCCIGRGVAALRHQAGSRSYTYYAMKTLAGRFARFNAEGTVFGSIGKRDFLALDWVCAKNGIVDLFEKQLSPLDEQITVNERNTRSLGATRDTLLPKLMAEEVLFEERGEVSCPSVR